MLDRLARGSRAGASRVGRWPCAAPVASVRVDGAEHAVRLAVRRRDLQRLLGRRHRFLHPVLAHVEVGELGGDLRRRRIERHRALVRGDRAVDVVVVLEPMRRAGTARTPRPTGSGRLRRPAPGAALWPRSRAAPATPSSARSDEHDLHTVELFHKSGEVSYSPAHGCRPGIARNSRLSELQDAGHAREERHRAQVRHVQPCLPDQGRHPGDAHRRGDDRRMNRWMQILQIASNSRDPARPAAPDRRRRLHDAGRPRAARSAFPTRTSPTSSSRPPRRSSAQPAPRRRHRRAAPPRAARPARRRRRSSGGCGARGSISRSISTAARARRCSTWLSGAPVRDRLRRRRPRLDVHARASPRPRELRPRHSVENQWDLLDAARHRRRPTATRIPVEMPVDRGCGRGASAARLARGGRRRRRSAHRDARQRRQPVPALADRVVRGGRRDSRGDDAATPRSSSRPGRPSATPPRASSRTRARRLPAGRAAASLACGEFSLRRAARAGRPRGALHRRRQRSAAHRRDEPRADRRRSTVRRCRRGRRRGERRAGRRRRSRPTGCPAGRATSGSARRATSAV